MAQTSYIISLIDRVTQTARTIQGSLNRVTAQAEQVTAAIDGILLARQVRYDVYVKTMEALMQAATAAGQDPRLAGRQGDPRMQTGTTRRGRGTPSRSTGRRRR